MAILVDQNEVAAISLCKDQSFILNGSLKAASVIGAIPTPADAGFVPVDVRCRHGPVSSCVA